jgi:hypothetical protein
VIESGAYTAELDPTSRFNTDASFMASLRDQGRQRAEAWLEENLGPTGARSPFALDAASLRA